MIRLLLSCFLVTLGFVAAAQTGNVGIGTTAPKAQLHTTGSVRFDTLAAPGNRPVYADENGRLYSPYPQNTNATGGAIPDGMCVGLSSSITITNMPTAVPSGNIRVRIDITHTYDENLLIFLISPSGQVLNLAYNNGSINENYTNTIFWDGATQLLSNSSAPFTGLYKPFGSLNAYFCAATTGTVSTFGQLDGGTIVPNGTWTLKVIDYNPGNTGRLNNWSITFNNTNPPLPDFSPNYIQKVAAAGSLINSSIYDNGNVGIGTTTPSQKLEVVGTIKASSFSGDGSALANVVNTTAAQTIAGAKTFSGTLIANGNVGIGTPAPIQKLDVTGIVKATGFTTSQVDNNANMLAVAYGNVGNAGNHYSSSGDFTMAHTPGSGIYQINFGSRSVLYNYNTVDNLPIVATLYDIPGFIAYSGGVGYVIIKTYNTSGTLADRAFSYVIFKP